MLGAILKDKEESNYLYFKKQDNNLIYYGFCVKENNLYPIGKNIVDVIYNLVKVNSDCTYIGDYLDFKVYLDNKNNLKHYLKNNIEDFTMFFKNNGEDLILYSKKSEKDSESKEFHIGKKILKISLGILLTITSYFVIFSEISAQLTKGNFTNNIQYSLAKPVYSISEYLNLDLNCIDVSEGINLINSSQLPDDMKSIFANENLLEDVFQYYKGTDMEYLIKYKLKNIKIRLYDPTEIFIPNPQTTDGFYNDIAPNVINAKNIGGYEEILKHEFIHLLQSPDKSYPFLKEAVAELAANEYLDKPFGSYIPALINLELLMNTIGPKVIWETVFSGDDTNLVSILKNNLNEEDYNELIFYLKSRPEDVESNSKDFNSIVARLYENINSKNIRDDKDIYNEYGYMVGRYYFNTEKINSDLSVKSINEMFPDQAIRSNNLVK